MTVFNIIVGLVMAIGIPTIIGTILILGRKLEVLDSLNKTTDKIKLNVKVIGDALIQSELTDFNGENLQTYSPVQITDKGNKYLEDIGFIKLFSEHEEDFFRCVEVDEPKTDYDIEIASIKSILYLFDKPYFDVIKNHLYNNPTEGKSSFTKTAGIYVRNKYMKKTTPDSK